MIAYATDNKVDVIWMAWERHRRTIELCERFDISLITYSSSRSRVVRYIYLSIKTMFELMRRRPKVLIVQNPSILLTLIACVFKNIFKYKLMVDTHNAGIVPENKLLKKLTWLYRYFHKKADITIVTNNNLARIISNDSGQCFVLPDRLPGIPAVKMKYNDGKYKIVYICTFGEDEPYLHVIEAALAFDCSIQFFVTGDIAKFKHKSSIDAPQNLFFTGYLSQSDYWSLLSSSDLVVDLTFRDDCLLCGAYEAVAVEVPLLLTDTNVLREYFYKGVVYTSNSTSEIVNNIIYAKKNRSSLKDDIKSLKVELSVSWEQIARQFEVEIEQLLKAAI